jgi:ATP-binding cassette subfamily F protein 3
MLTVNSLSKHHGDRLILDRISFTINSGERLGLVGPNGAGKSTLLAILAGTDAPDAGSISAHPGVRIGFLRQGFADRSDLTLGELIAVTSERTGSVVTALERLDAATVALGQDPATDTDPLADYDRAMASFEALGGYQATDELMSILGRLGLEGVPFSTPLTHLSGGQKTRAGLAALLADQPDVLLLDEPTNHLDLDALTWLEQFLVRYRGAVVIVSHDRTFLDRTVTAILELDIGTRQITRYQGGYSDYLAARAAAEAAQADAFARQQRTIARINQDIKAVAAHGQQTEKETQHDYIRARAKKVARTAKVRERKLERMLESEDHIEKPERRWGLALEFAPPAESGRDVLSLDQVDIELGGRPILTDVDLRVRHGERIAITGPNGAGKTTLLRTITGDLIPSRGQVRIGASVVLGQHNQEQETVKLDQTVLEQVRAAAPISESDARTFLHKYLFSGDMVFQRGAELSYGERSRLALALLVLRGANVLLLDEPLNHLDLDSRTKFEEALANFAGTLLVILHDRYAIERLATRVLEVRDGEVRETPIPIRVSA